jgi:citrate lyase subunit beta/citryl-CoA lyase
MYRSLLFIPGNQPRMIEKAAGFRPDAYIPDLEDSVADADKAEARNTVRERLGGLVETGVPVIPRINARDTGLAEKDLDSIVRPEIRGVSIGKVHTPDDVAWLSAQLSRLESERGMIEGSLELVLWIESALGIVNCYEICRASERISAVAFGGEDFTHDMAIERLDGDRNVDFARNTICIAARAAGVLALDTPYFQFRDKDGLVRNAQASKHIGFKGKFAIHPAQVDTINRVFSPSDEEFGLARRVVAAYEEAERNGRGSTSLDGNVIDVPVYKRARALLASLN